MIACQSHIITRNSSNGRKTTERGTEIGGVHAIPRGRDDGQNEGELHQRHNQP